MNGGRAVPLQRQPMFRARVALVGLKTPERIILGIVAHQPISAYLCQHRGRRNGKARCVGLHFGHHVCNVGRNKIPLAVDDRTCFSQVDTFTKLRKCTFRSQPLRSIHAQLIALCVRRRTDGPPRARCRNVIEHCFALCFRQLFRVARAAHQRAWVFRLDDVVREYRNANDKRPGPCAFAHLVYSHNIVMPSRQQLCSVAVVGRVVTAKTQPTMFRRWLLCSTMLGRLPQHRARCLHLALPTTTRGALHASARHTKPPDCERQQCRGIRS